MTSRLGVTMRRSLRPSSHRRCPFEELRYRAVSQSLIISLSTVAPLGEINPRGATPAADKETAAAMRPAAPPGMLQADVTGLGDGNFLPPMVFQEGGFVA